MRAHERLGLGPEDVTAGCYYSSPLHMSLRQFRRGARSAPVRRRAPQPQPSSLGVHAAVGDARHKAKLIREQRPDDLDLVIAHSLGAVPVALEYSAGALRAPLVLVEPALYDVARGDPAVEAHIGTVTVARARAAGGDLYGFWQFNAPLMFSREATIEAWPEDLSVAERLVDLQPPWGHGIRAADFIDVQVLVVTGNWSAEFEAIAAKLAEVGAEHVRLTGSGHRPQDQEEFESVLVSFAAESPLRDSP